MYSYDDAEGNINSVFEDIIGDIENKSFPIVRYVSESSELQDSDVPALITYMALSLLRNPVWQEAVVQFHRDAVQSFAKILEQRGELTPFDGGGPLHGKQFSDLVDEGIVDLQINNDRFLISIKDAFMSLVKALSGFSYSLIICDSGQFSIGDHPLTYFHPGKNFGPYGLPLGGDNCEVTFPLSAHVSVYGQWQRPTPKLYSKYAVREANRRQAVYANIGLATRRESQHTRHLTRKYRDFHFGSDTQSIPSEGGYLTISRRSILPVMSGNEINRKTKPIISFDNLR